MAKVEVDEEYVKVLENKLKKLRKDTAQLNSKQILTEIKSYREDKLFQLLTKKEQCFEDNFIDQPLNVSYLQRKIAPQKVAVTSGELIALLKADQLQVKKIE